MMYVKAMKLAASTLAVGAAAVTGVTFDSATASQSAQAEMMKVASNAAAVARKSIASKKGEVAVRYAEKAVAAMPQDASYRLLLGEAYLADGRFASAETAFGDVLKLDPGNGRAALKMSLAMAAQGKSTDALAVLDQHREQMNAGDYGLALVLAGQPGAAIQVLNTAARSIDATPKIRQNLAFAHAMAGNWAIARTIAGQDLAGDTLHQRIGEWAILARPQTVADQVAGILGVKPSEDAGQPMALALGTVVDAPTALATAEMPTTEAEVASASSSVSMPLAEAVSAEVQAENAPAADPVAAVEGVASAQKVVFGPRQEIVQPIPAKRGVQTSANASNQMIIPASNNVSAKPMGAGKFAVQLGAYSSPRRAEQGWNRLSNKISSLGSYDPQTARVRVNAASLYRLSVTGFTTREDAGRVCTQIRTAGAECFIRSVAGDAPLRWALRTPKMGTRVAVARR